MSFSISRCYLLLNFLPPHVFFLLASIGVHYLPTPVSFWGFPVLPLLLVPRRLPPFHWRNQFSFSLI